MNRPDPHDIDRMLDWLCVLPDAGRAPVLAEAARWLAALTPAPARPARPEPGESEALAGLLRQLVEQATAQEQMPAGFPQVAVLPQLEPCPRCGATGLGVDNAVIDGPRRYAVHTFDCPHCGLTLPPPRPPPGLADGNDLPLDG